MKRPPPRHCYLALALAAALAAPAHAQQVVADGDDQIPAAGDYRTTEPVLPGDPAGHAFYAINGGRILPTGPVNLFTEGARAHAAHVEGAASYLQLHGGSVTTAGSSAAGLSVASGAALAATGVNITTTGNSAHGVIIADGSAALKDVHIQANGDGVRLTGAGSLEMQGGRIDVQRAGAHGVYANAGTAQLTGTSINLQSADSTGVMATGTGQAFLRDVSLSGDAYGATGVTAQTGASAQLHNVQITLGGGAAAGVALGGELDIVSSRIHVAEGRAVSQTGGTLRVRDSELAGETALRLMRSSKVAIANSTVTGRSMALFINGPDAEVDIDGSVIRSESGPAVWMPNRGRLQVRGSEIRANGAGGHAIEIRAGQVALEGSRVATQGRSAFALVAQDDANDRPLIEAVDTKIETHGDDAYAIVARTGGSARLKGSAVLTTGARSHGLITGGAGETTLFNTHVRTEGGGAWAAVVNDNGRFSIDGGSLVSAQHGGIWMRSSRDPALVLSNGAVVAGGNGIALALDAAVAGRFDVNLRDGSLMIGDIVTTPEDEDAGLAPQSQVHVLLSGNALWQGSSQRLQGLALDGGSQWTLTGNARVQDLAVRDSVVVLSDGSGGFNMLRVDGDLHTDGAMFLFNGELAGDASAMDRLHVRGDASGTAKIAVTSTGGMGAPTLNGIQLIRIDGASLADYSLAGRAVGGAYEYFLFKGGLLDPADGNWYLRSQWIDICEADPNAPGCVVDPGPDPDPVDPTDPVDPIDHTDPVPPPPVLRPEAGAYLANQSTAVSMFAHRLGDRMGAIVMGDERAAWARVGRSTADFTAVGNQLVVDGNTSVLQIGSDVLRRGNTAFGVMLGSGRADNTVASRLTGYSAKGRVQGTAVGMYGTWLQQADGTDGAYVDAQLQYGRFSNRVQGDALARERYDACTRSGSLEGGYTFAVRQGASSNLYVQPQVQLTYTAYDADRHVESNGTVVDGAEAGGLAGRVGVRVFGQRAGMGTVVQPYASVNWLRSSGRNAVDFRAETLRADLPRNRYEVQAGAELKISQRMSAWGGLSVERGDHGYRNVNAQVGVRLSW